ncbi:hypothetical protein J437_LFUL010111 [Ladona fulva]|uniref:Uncharacterized protein n=1 Tax=Ladona fulva TaxID=123851 RepID=A0A8K0P6Q6_LADFU|nr:hypothetical protein J437_LFUL010111 [Ladona fulva]
MSSALSECRESLMIDLPVVGRCLCCLSTMAGRVCENLRPILRNATKCSQINIIRKIGLH